MTPELKAIGWCVLVIEDRLQEKTVSGISLPQMSQMPPCTGRVLSIGPDALKEYPELRVGFRVHFKPVAFREGRRFEWRGLKLRALEHDELLALVGS